MKVVNPVHLFAACDLIEQEISKNGWSLEVMQFIDDDDTSAFLMAKIEQGWKPQYVGCGDSLANALIDLVRDFSDEFEGGE